MRRASVSITYILLVLMLAAVPLRAAMTVPSEFVIEKVAGPPLVERPMMAGFDDRGRLFVAESAGLNFDFKKLSENPPNFIRLLIDSDSDGTFDKSTIFADRMTFPSGALWHEGALYVTSPPSLWKLEDLNDDGVCDKRTEIVTGFGSIGNGADLHGPFLGPDGWLYFCDGRNGHNVKLADGSTWSGKAAAVYRCRTDGSGLEVVFGGGMDNPVEVVFTREGEMLVSCNLVVAHPQRMDGILYGIEGGVYPHDAAYREFKRTGELLRPVGDLGWVAISGMTRFDGNAFGEGFDGNLFSALFNPHRVQRHRVQRDGAGFRISSEDFLTSDDPDFHPTDVLQDADGNLLVVDTGGWFRIGCPASKTEKPQVLGGIYRIRRDGADIHAPPRARDEIDRVWAALRSGMSKGHEAIRTALGSSDPAVRRTAIRAAGLAGDHAALAAVVASLASTDPAESREAALALARIGNMSSTAPLLAALKRAADRFHEHAIIHALIRIADRPGVAAGLSDKNPAVRRGAMIALDQMPSGNPTPDEIIPLLSAPEPVVREEAMTIVASRPDWGAHVAGNLRAAIGARDQRTTRALVVAFSRDAKVQAVITEGLGDAHMRAVLLDAIAGAPLKKLPPAWKEAIQQALGASDQELIRTAVDVVRARGEVSFDDALLRIARDSGHPEDLRIAALSAAAARITPNDADLTLLLSQLDPQRPPLVRLAAAQCVSRASFTDAQLMQLAAAFATASPLEMPQLLTAFERSRSSAAGIALIAALERSPARQSLSAAALRKTIANFPPDVAVSADALVKQADAAESKQQTRVTELEPLLQGGDPSRGQAVFLSKTAACATCHTVGGFGTAVGPDLTKIATMRSGRDLLESIVFPSVTIARGYEPFVVETTDGKTHAGILLSESADAITLKTPTETTIPRSQVKLFRPDRVSIMPQGLDAQLSQQELRDLLAFLQACK